MTSEDIKAAEDNNEIDEVLVAAGDKVSKGDKLITFTDDRDPITPADGTITSVSVKAGERVTNGFIVVHLTDYEDLQTVVQVDELDPREVILERVWGLDADVALKTIDATVKLIRKKLQLFNKQDRFQSFRGVGYKFER